MALPVTIAGGASLSLQICTQMSEGSKIEWTEHTFNPWWGCAKVSPGCKNCYAEGMSNRHTKRLFGHESVWGIHNPRGFFNAKHWQKPYEWNRKAEKAGRRDRVFCASMADVFEKHPDGETNVMMEAARFHLFQAIEATPNLIWLLLTKRPENIISMVPAEWNKFNYPKNICLMTSAEDQKRANERIRCLVNVPAVVHHGLSLEPLLGPINLKESIDGLGLIDWVIVGGESGPGARPMHPEWARDLRDQCVGADIPFFFKQWGKWVHAGDNRFAPDEGRVEWFDLGDDDGAIPMRNVGKKKAGRLLDGRFWNEHPFDLKAEVV